MISQPANGGGKHRRQTGARRGDHTFIRLTELVTQSVDMRVVNAGHAPELLECDKAHADGRRTAEHSPAVAVTMDAELRVRAQNLHGRQPDGIHADHDADAAVCQHMVVTAQHLVDISGKVNRIHHLLARPVGVIAQHAQNRGGPLFEGTVRPIGLQFVIFDEVDPRLGQGTHLRGSRLRAHANARFDDGADERPLLHAREPARSRHAELRTLIAIEERRRQTDVEQFESRKRLELEQVARDRRQKVGQRWAGIFQRPGKRNLRGTAYFVWTNSSAFLSRARKAGLPFPTP